MNALNKFLLVIAASNTLGGNLATAQALLARPRFEVASVKRNISCGGPRQAGGRPTPGRVNLECVTRQTLIGDAYYVFADGVSMNPKWIEIVGGPNWRTTETYSISAVASDGAPATQMYGPMMQTLLEERFKLRLHRSSREGAVYFLTVAKSGPKLARTKEGACITIDPNHPPSPTPSARRPTICGDGGIHLTDHGTAAMRAIGITMDVLANNAQLTVILGRPIIDRTGLSGQFDLNLEFTPERRAQPDPSETASGQAVAPTPARPSIFDAIEQLGLRLEPGKGPVEIFVIDHLERPDEN